MNFYIFAENIYYHELLHFFVAFFISIFIYRKYKNWRLVILVFIVSFFIDADHYLEGIIYRRFHLNWKFFAWPGYYWGATGKVTVFFHGWEYLPLLLLLGQKFKKFRPVLQTLFFAALGHYLVDTTTYCLLSNMSWWHYFLTYRIWLRFETSKLCPSCMNLTF